MKHISLLVPKGPFVVNTVEGPHTIFSAVNNFLLKNGKPSIFKIQLVGLLKQNQVNSFYNVTPDVTLKQIDKTDLIIIPAFLGDINIALENNRDYIPWIIKQHKKGAEVASLCMGAFLLASTGLLKGRQCATHWAAENTFREMFPDVDLVAHKIITDGNGIYSSGGAFLFMNLILYLVEKYAGKKSAIHCAKHFAIEIDRRTQAPFIVFTPQKDHDDLLVKKAQEYIEHHYRKKVTIDQLASMLSISRRNLERRFKKATYNTILNYTQRVRIEVAKMLLESTFATVNEVMKKSGYSDTKAFHSTFKRLTGITPGAFRKKYLVGQRKS